MELITELFDYQAEAVQKLIHVKVGALYMEMGTGKTRTALELIKRRIDANKVKQVLWLCPYSTVKDIPETVSEHATGFESVIRFAGIESLSNSTRIYRELLTYVQTSPTYLIVDESLLVKNPDAYRTKRIIFLSECCSYKLILNGTPVSKSIADLFSQWYVLDWRILGYRSFWSFSANHLEYDENRPGRIVRAHNVEYLAEKIAPYTYEVAKSVLQLPSKEFHSEYFHLTEEQDEHYSTTADALLALIDDRRPETIYRLFSAMQAITSGFAIRLDGYHSSRLRMYQPESNPRIQALLQVINSIGDDQAVIYCRFTQEISDILSILGSRALPFYGEMPQRLRQRNKNRFKAGEAQFLVANKSCAQFGLNLQFCHHEIFYNNDWDWGTREQAEDRLHRIGQTQTVQIYDIIAANTIDEAIVKCLSRKENIADSFKRAVRENNNIMSAKDILRGKYYGKDLSED